MRLPACASMRRMQRQLRYLAYLQAHGMETLQPAGVSNSRTLSAAAPGAAPAAPRRSYPVSGR